MDYKRTIPLIIAGTAFGLHEAHLEHLVATEMEKELTNGAVAQAPVYCCLRHGNEPEQPGPPPRTSWTVAVSTASSIDR